MRPALIWAALVLGSAMIVPSAAGASPGRTWDVGEMHGFVDGLMEAQQKAYHFAGAVVVVVSNGQVVLQKGYGYADFAERKAVNPERTLFRIASNSKMFVWTAVMQIVEEGKIDLRADVNQYLKGFRVPSTFPVPVTMEHLMTHTAGFEDHVIGLFSESADKMRPLAELMQTQMPKREFPPGQMAAYSNYGTTLAALVVEQVSGIPYERYLVEKILRPLGMAHSALSQPLPGGLAADMSRGYEWIAGRLEDKPFEYVPWGPCGGMSVSGADMGRFMIAHLRDGSLGEARILRPETARTMRTRLSSPYSLNAGMLHGFFPMDWNGQKVFGHGGDTVWFHSQTAMMPEQDLGVFVAYNTDSGSRARSEFLPAFLDHYYPKPLPKEPPPPKDRQSELRRFSGTYFAARSSFTDVSKIGRLVNAYRISVDSDGYLVSVSEGDPVRWRQVEPLLFQQVDGKRRIAFREDSAGEILDFCSSPLCIVAMQKQPWWETPNLQRAILGTCLALLAGGLIGIPIAAVFQRRQSRPRLSKLARLAAWLSCLLWIAGFGYFALKMQELQRIVFGPTPELKLVLNIWLAAALSTIIHALFALAAWRHGWWRPTGRLFFALLVLGSIGCILWLNHWNLLGWKY
jgi:CubicO group peptidase (beta-lactamase class C family)